jgi:tetratricopeptide (TPR) repeat protein
MDPADVLLSVRKADILYAQGQYRTASKILEDLNDNPESPQYVTEWLGLYLLFVPNRTADAIKFSKDYFTRFPGDASSPYNAARGYAELYRQECDVSGVVAIPASTNRSESLRYLSQSIALDPTGRDWAREESVAVPEIKHSSRQWFICLANDTEFKSMTAPRAVGTGS